MKRVWTVESAKAYVAKVQKGKQQSGLTYCSALDFLTNHSNVAVNLHPLAAKDNDNDDTDTDK